MEAQKRRHLEADHDKQSSKAEKKDIQVSNGERREGKREREKGGGMEGGRVRERKKEKDCVWQFQSWFGLINALQDSLVREDNLKVEERSKVMVGTRYENQRRELNKSLKAKQDSLKAKHRQGGWKELIKALSRLVPAPLIPTYQ